MNDATLTAEAPKRERLLTFRSGGWVILLAVVMMSLVLLQALMHLGKQRAARIGDGHDVSTYQFDLETTLIPRDEIVAGGMWRDKTPPLVDPETWTLGEHESRKSRRGKTMLLPGDRVIGVSILGEARAYPLMIMNWHEVANDTLGGKRIAVSYHPLCDGVAVFDREVDGETIEFGISGLLWNSNQLLYDRRETIGTESLWSQLQGRAVAGPSAAAGKTLEPVEFRLMTWGKWKAAHPETTVLSPLPALARDYKRRPYAPYFSMQQPREEFPVSSYPPPGERSRAWKRIAVLADGRLVRYEEDAPKARYHAFWWAWHSTHAGSPARPE
ncbi:MAG: DUF3179 domain-containing (seleno)protein [Planctomycetota bacterium]